MSTECSTAPVVPWNWIIQSLANFKQVDPCTLVGLVKKAPAIKDDLSKDAREMVSLRILESLFVSGNEATIDTDPAQNAKIHFDPSENCEDVLHKILDETSEPMADSERQKWDVCPFVIQKRDSLPKSPLEKLKEALLEGSHPILASLKERSKLGVANISDDTIPGVDVNFDAQTGLPKDYLVPPNPVNENKKFQEKPLQKFDQEQNSTRGIPEQTGREECEMSMDHDENTFMDHSKPNQRQPPAPQNMQMEGQDKRLSIDRMENLEFVRKNDIQSHVSNRGHSSEEKNSMEHDGQHETGTDNKRFDDERTDIAAKKEAFLSSQCTLTQDSMVAMNDWTEVSLCMKCNVGGQLLVCSSDACPLRVHKSCLGSAATLDENGKFFCPFCAYSHAISKYIEVKKKTSLARKDLQAFLRVGVECISNVSSAKGARSEKSESRKIGALGETIKANSNRDAVSRGNINCMSNKDNCVNNELNCGDKGVPVSNQSLPEAEDLPQKPIRQTRTPKRKCNEKESPVSFKTSHSRRPNKQMPQDPSHAVRSLGRKTLPWTKAEEEILKEAVWRFSSDGYKKIPWKEILDYGGKVFQKGRTAFSLKHKWRKMGERSRAPKIRKL